MRDVYDIFLFASLLLFVRVISYRRDTVAAEKRQFEQWHNKRHS